MSARTLYKHALGGGAVAEAIRQVTATEPLMRTVDFDALYRYRRIAVRSASCRRKSAT